MKAVFFLYIFSYGSINLHDMSSTSTTESDQYPAGETQHQSLRNKYLIEQQPLVAREAGEATPTPYRSEHSDWPIILLEVRAQQLVFWSSSALLLSFATGKCPLQLRRRQRIRSTGNCQRAPEEPPAKTASSCKGLAPAFRS